jgi:hypothetical protein
VARTLARVQGLSQRPTHRESETERRNRFEQVLRSQAHLALVRHQGEPLTQGLRARLTWEEEEDRRIRYGR